MHLDVNVQPYCQLRGIFVCIHRDASRRLARKQLALIAAMVPARALSSDCDKAEESEHTVQVCKFLEM